ncbi:hypothetical protein PUN28_005398 [Cardiocondyla obscurior]|uniref:Uncharacterized protein n=1 Tax=Cardiocondyla obscurior TaxID=286306 RepID=A0AAW2GGA7_9HYME
MRSTFDTWSCKITYNCHSSFNSLRSKYNESNYYRSDSPTRTTRGVCKYKLERASVNDQKISRWRSSRK